jgi:hypothetical protein
MSMLRTCFVLAAALVVAAPVAAQQAGTPAVKSIEAIAFGPEGLLLIGDSKGAQVVTVQTGDTKAREWSVKEVADIKGQLAGRLGAMASGIEIQKMAVNPASNTAYVAVRNVSPKTDVILTIAPDGKINEFSLQNVKYTAYPLATGDKSSVTKITDLTYADGRILVAAQANDTFAAKIFAIDTRSKDAAAVCVSTETYHVAHGRWETNAPIRTVIPYQEGGKMYLVGAFTCTPIVKYSLSDVATGSRVKGQSVVELGNGNEPRDMIAYEKDGRPYILLTTLRKFNKNPVGPSPYWTARVDLNLLKETEKINESALRRIAPKGNPAESQTERATVAQTFHGVMYMDRLGANQALVIRGDGKNGTNLAILPLP